MRTRGRADQRFRALETMPTSELAHHRPCPLEDKLTSEGARERPCSLERTGAGFRRCATQLGGGEGQAQLRWARLIRSFLRGGRLGDGDGKEWN